MERCPCCNARLRDATLCSRCQSDLSVAAAAEQASKDWFDKAIQQWRNGEIEHCLSSFQQSQNFKQSPLTKALFDSVMDKQCNDILNLLAQQQTLAAKQRVYTLQRRFPEHLILRQLDDFIDYRLLYSS